MTTTGGPLTGLRVAVTRSTDRAGALADALAEAGAEPVLVPGIDFETSDQDVLGAALHRLAAGNYAWLVISSITTVRALKQWCNGAGTSLADLIPAGTQVATIGPTSVAVLAAEGIHASLAPGDLQSAAGLVELWPEFTAATGTNTKVLLPASNLAEPTLVDGISAKGWEPEAVTAYHTVSYPGAQERRLGATLAKGPSSQSPVDLEPGAYPLLAPAEATVQIQAGTINAVVLASGSAARKVAAAMGPLPAHCLVIAIGQPTRVEAERLGICVAATAEHPTPRGIVSALAHARVIFE